MTDQNKTHGVLTDGEIHDLGLIAMQAGWPNAELARAIEAAVLAKAAPQSPVAPADERAASKYDPRDPGNWRDGDDAIGNDRAHLADAPKEKLSTRIKVVLQSLITKHGNMMEASDKCGLGAGAIYQVFNGHFDKVFDLIDATTVSATANEHIDDDAVDRFAEALKEKLAHARKKGRSGWHECDPRDLSTMLREHVEKGDPRDVANFCMFLWSLGQPISPILGLADHIESLRRISERASNAAPTPPTSAADAVKTCVCGQPLTLGVVHRAEAPCFIYATGEAPALRTASKESGDE